MLFFLMDGICKIDLDFFVVFFFYMEMEITQE